MRNLIENAELVEMKANKAKKDFKFVDLSTTYDTFTPSKEFAAKGEMKVLTTSVPEVGQQTFTGKEKVTLVQGNRANIDISSLGTLASGKTEVEVFVNFDVTRKGESVTMYLWKYTTDKGTVIYSFRNYKETVKGNG